MSVNKVNMNCISFVLIVILSIIFINGKDVAPKNDLERKMLYLTDKWRNGEMDALPYPMPRLDVFKMPPFNGKYDGVGMKMTFSMSEMSVTGLNNFTVTEMDLSENDLEASGVIEMPMVNMTADNYKLDGRAFVVYKLKGSGRLNIHMRDIKLVCGFRVKDNGTRAVVDDLKLDFDIGTLEVDLENSSWPVNKMLNTEGLKIMNRYHDKIISATRENMIEFFNDFLIEMPPKRFFNIMANVNCSCLEETTLEPLE